MNYFICTLEMHNLEKRLFTGNLGICTEKIERIIPASRVQTAIYETENQDVFISLPLLFQLKDTSAPHGLVLKPRQPALQPVKTILLTPKINTEMEIPEKDILPLPDTLAGMLGFFRGVYFAGQKMILILDPEKLYREGGK